MGLYGDPHFPLDETRVWIQKDTALIERNNTADFYRSSLPESNFYRTTHPETNFGSRNSYETANTITRRRRDYTNSFIAGSAIVVGWERTLHRSSAPLTVALVIAAIFVVLWRRHGQRQRLLREQRRPTKQSLQRQHQQQGQNADGVAVVMMEA